MNVRTCKCQKAGRYSQEVLVFVIIVIIFIKSTSFAY